MLINGCYGNRNMKWLKVLNCTHTNSFWVNIVQFLSLCVINHGTYKHKWLLYKSNNEMKLGRIVYIYIGGSYGQN